MNDQNKNLIIGSHVDFSRKSNYFQGAVETTIANGANALMFYTGAPQSSKRTPLEELKIDEGLALIKEHQIDEKNIIVHAPYIINLGNIDKQQLFNSSVSFLINELKRADACHANAMVLHPGASLNNDPKLAMDQIIKGLNLIFSETPNVIKTTIALETMAGKGTEVGINFEQIKYLIDGINDKTRISVCLDTCHTWDAGYNWQKDLDQIIEQFDQIINLKYLSVIHLNDSKNPLFSHKDRHENIGNGYIGFEILAKIAHHAKLKNIPKILETPYIDKTISPYKEEIAKLRNY